MFERERRLYAFVLKYCRMLVEDVTDEQLTVQPVPGVNHPAWILGHLAIATDSAARLLGQRPACPPDWRAKFGPGSQVVADRSAYPPKSELLAAIEAGHARVAELVANAPADVLDRPHAAPFLKEELPTVGDLVAHLMTTHPTTHLGQLSAWRRLMGLPGVLKI
ncbi:MAG TPA: DinB family protein [Planctomycetaceae bacterium]|nr:DinB family protein [Planctomycetaceae bacterium]